MEEEKIERLYLLSCGIVERENMGVKKINGKTYFES